MGAVRMRVQTADKSWWVEGDLLFSAGGKCRRCCPFLESDMVLVVQVRSSVMCTPRNLVLLTLSTVELSMVSGGWSTEFLLKSNTTSFVFPTLRDRLLVPHHSASCATSSLYCVSSLLLMRPTAVVSSANLMMWLELNLAVQSWVSSVKSNGLSTQPCGAPVLSVVVLEVLWLARTDWGLPVRSPGSNYRGNC